MDNEGDHVESKPFIQCKSCGRHENFILDKPMSPIEILREFHCGWYIGSNGFICPECVLKFLEGC